MTLATVAGYDVTAKNYARRPPSGQAALYVTGTSDIIATPAMLKENPHAITINQSGANVIADEYDVETGAITPAQLPGLIRNAQAAWLTGNGRRRPVAYVNQSNKTAVVNALTSAKITNVGLHIADYSLTEAQAITLLQMSNGPYPVIGYQYNDAGEYDEDVWLESWVNDVSTTDVWHGVAIVMKDGTESGEGKYWVVPIESVDQGVTYTPTGPGEAK